MEQLTTATLTQLPQVRALGRHTGRDPLTLFWTASGMELEFTGSELWVDLFADYEAVEPWVSVELNGAWVARFAVNPGKSRICLFRGMTPGKAKHLRLLKDVQAMHDDPAHLLQITGLEYAGGEFLPLPEPQYRLEFVGDSITSGEGAIGAKPEEDWVGAFFSAENHYGRLTADALGAEYRCISQSGWGIVTGWDNDVRHVMPPYYTQVCGVAMGQRNAALGAQQENDFAAWKPDAVIVNLGTNDTGAFDNPPWQDPATGKPRQLHIPQALDVTLREPPKAQDFHGHLAQCDYFTVDAVEGDFEDVCDETSFTSLLVLEGKGTLTETATGESLPIRKGQSLFLPAGTGAYTVTGTDLKCLRTRV